MDVCSAFLNGEINVTIYMKIPEGVEEKSSKVCKLTKSIYGLKKSPKYWYEKSNNLWKMNGLLGQVVIIVYTRKTKRLIKYLCYMWTIC